MNTKPAESSTLTTPGPTYAEAFEFARACHQGQFRKGTAIPYICHLQMVSALVLEYGGSEAEAMAGLLHDVLEDCDARFARSLDGTVAEEIEARFGREVARIVLECSDSIKVDGEEKPPWEHRKKRYLAELPHKSRGALLVTACDKLHNLTAIVRDHQALGDELWKRFNGGREGTRWYYERLGFELQAAGVAPARDFALKLAELGWSPLEEKVIDATIRELS